MMKKRGQITIFAIVGVIIVAVIVLFLVVRNKLYFDTPTIENLEKEFPPIQDHIEKCLIEGSKEAVVKIGRQGGYLTANPGTYRDHLGEKINYLCYNIQGKPDCSNRGLRLSDIKTSLENAIIKDINRCLDIDQFDKYGITGKALDVSRGEVKLNLDIGEDKVIINADLPVRITKGDVETSKNDFEAELNYPLGRLYDSARNIVESEALNGNIDTLTYSVLKTRVTGKPYIIQKLQPYPDKLYILKIKDTPSDKEEYIFQFFVQDEPL